MAKLSPMPQIQIDNVAMKNWGQIWLGTTTETGTKESECFNKKQGIHFGYEIDKAVGISFAEMLGNIPIEKPQMGSLQSKIPDCVEVGPAMIVGGIRPQNFDVAYRPDGPRIAYDSKTLNDSASVGKNWRNMLNDLATESSTVHTRFPYCLVGFIVVIPRPALNEKYENDITRTLERLGTREKVLDEPHLAEAVSFVVWDPNTGNIDPNVPEPTSNIRLERFSERFYNKYLERYKGLPPHDE